jgi:hypothetical protein
MQVDNRRGVEAHERPVAIHGMEISVADTRVLDVDEDFVRGWLLDGDLLIVDGAAGLLDNLRPLLLGNFWHCAKCDKIVGERVSEGLAFSSVELSGLV